MKQITTDTELSVYLSKGIRSIITDIISACLKNPGEAAFLAGFGKASLKAEKRRTALENDGVHVPAFLIASITSSCNLLCKGCYAVETGCCSAENSRPLLSGSEWDGIFKQARDAGVSFILLAGGEPFLRKDVLEKAAHHKEIVFPVFTNGTFIDDDYTCFLNLNRNIVPVLSIEGFRERTDYRRGAGVFDVLLAAMDRLSLKKILFGVSITVTTENLKETTSPEFIDMLYTKGCRIIFFIEYVPMDPDTEYLAFSDDNRNLLDSCIIRVKNDWKSILFLSFPGDEEAMGGCLAAGRGFFHINPYGEAEACPFSPYSDCSLKDYGFLEILSSPLFKRLKDDNLSGAPHTGGCALFRKKDEVESILKGLVSSE